MAGMRDKVIHVYFASRKISYNPQPVARIAGDGLRRFENERERYPEL